MRSRCIALVFAALLSVGCGRVDVRGNDCGNYHDPDNPAARYELLEGGAWVAELELEVPAGVFPHGSGLRLEGHYSRRGEVIELVCVSASRQDPMSGDYEAEAGDASRYNHRFAVGEGELLPVGANGEREALFLSDLNPLGVRRLVRIVK
jgi:hypothetical protein